MDATGPKRSKDMTLVKDMHNHRIVYYWSDLDGQQISPELPSQATAEEWRREYLQTAYEGYQRRTSTVDRRLYQHKREQHPRAAKVESLFHSGRRSTDRPARVVTDLAAEKLQELFDQYQRAQEKTDKQQSN